VQSCSTPDVENCVESYTQERITSIFLIFSKNGIQDKLKPKREEERFAIGKSSITGK